MNKIIFLPLLLGSFLQASELNSNALQADEPYVVAEYGLFENGSIEFEVEKWGKDRVSVVFSDYGIQAYRMLPMNPNHGHLTIEWTSYGADKSLLLKKRDFKRSRKINLRRRKTFDNAIKCAIEYSRESDIALPKSKHLASTIKKILLN